MKDGEGIVPSLAHNLTLLLIASAKLWLSSPGTVPRSTAGLLLLGQKAARSCVSLNTPPTIWPASLRHWNGLIQHWAKMGRPLSPTGALVLLAPDQHAKEGEVLVKGIADKLTARVDRQPVVAEAATGPIGVNLRPLLFGQNSVERQGASPASICRLSRHDH